MTTLKCRLSEALGAAKALGEQIASTTIVDSIVCIDGTEIIGAFLAEELTRAGVYSMNAHNTIYIVPPEYSNAGELHFRKNLVPMIRNKNVLILMDSASTGKTILKLARALGYYDAKISGISSIFSAANSVMGIPINALFTAADIPDYRSYNPEDCPLCREGHKVDAFANGYGYSLIE